MFCPSPISSVEPHLESIKQHLVRDFRLAVALWVCQGGIHIPDAELLAEVFEEVGIELSPIVRDQSSWDPKSCDDVLLHKVPRILLGDGGQRFGLVPLGEIIVATSYSLELGGVVPRCPSPTEQRAMG